MKSRLALGTMGWMAVAALSCSHPPVNPDDRDLEDLDPAALSWIAPLTTDMIEVGDELTLAVATGNDAAQVVHFSVDGVEVGACDPSGTLGDAQTDCRDGEAWQWTVLAGAAGVHHVSAWFDAGGTTVRAERDVTVLADDGADPDFGEGDPAEPDPVGDGSLTSGATNFSVAAVTAARGYVDPDEPWHDAHGVSWRVAGGRIETRVGQGPPQVEQGSVETIARCMAAYGDSVERYGDLGYVSRASLVALAVAGGGCRNPLAGQDGYASGPMQLSASACHALDPTFSVAMCPRQMHAAPDLSFDLGTRHIAGLTHRHHHDPLRLAVTYVRGAARSTHVDRWHLAAPDGYLDRFVLAYNAYRTWERMGSPAPHTPVAVSGNAADVTPAFGWDWDEHTDPGDAALTTFAGIDAGFYRVGILYDLNTGLDAHQYDALVGHAAALGVTVLPCLSESGLRPPQSMPQWQTLTNVAQALAARFGNGGSFWSEHAAGTAQPLPAHPIRAWEIWNEQNSTTFWRTGAPDPVLYQRVLRTAHDALRAGDPSARVVYGGLAFVAENPHAAQFLEDSLSGVGDDGCLFDAVAIHPYAHDAATSLALVASIQAVLAARGDSGLGPATDAPIWITELGFAVALGASSYRGSPAASRALADVGMMEAAQSTQLAGVLDRVNTYRDAMGLGPFIVYDSTDFPGTPDAWANHCGLARLDGSLRPAWQAFQSHVQHHAPTALPPLRTCQGH